MKRLAAVLLLIIVSLALACKKAPDRIAVQHILIAFRGSIPEAKVTRTLAEAEALAKDIFARAQKGEDFDALVKQYTDDQYPGIYRMSNFDTAPDASKQEYPWPRWSSPSAMWVFPWPWAESAWPSMTLRTASTAGTSSRGSSRIFLRSHRGMG